MQFKVGDKFIVHNCEGNPKYNGKVGTVIETGRIAKIGCCRWDYLCAFEDYRDYPFGPPEMTKVYIKGQQMLFSFMKQ